MERLTNPQIAAAGLADWRKLGQAVHARFISDDGYRSAAAFVTAVAAAAGAHRPELRVGPGFVDIALATHADGIWVTDRDVEFARTISGLAAEHGLTAEPGAVTQLELALDTAHVGRLGPFWSALLTGEPDNTIYDSVFDPTGRVPALWFQETDEHEPPRQRWHFDLWLAPEVADARIAAALAAGGTVLYADRAPSFTVLADPDGNRVCVCTSLDRE